MAISYLADTLFTVPSVAKFLDRVKADVSQYRSVLVLVPPIIPVDDLWSTLRLALEHRGFVCRDVVLAEVEEASPIDVLSQTLAVEWGPPSTPRTLQNLLRAPDLPDVTYIGDVGDGPEQVRTRWLQFMGQWATANQGIASADLSRRMLCVIMPAAAGIDQLPQSNVHLALHWWFGFPSALETHLLCRTESGNYDWGTMTRWREHILASLAGSDVNLAEHLWDDLELDIGGILRRLLAYAGAQGWTSAKLDSWGATDLLDNLGYAYASQAHAPPSRLRRLWAHGALSITPEYGVELHSAALAMLERVDQVRHRLWRGQAEVVLPLIDHARLALCTSLTAQYGTDWPWRWCLPASEEEEREVRESPLACGWGHLEHLLRKQYIRPDSDWLPLVTAARLIRNEIAHYRPVHFRDYDIAVREIQQVIGLAA